MADSEETLKQNNEVLDAIAALSKRFDGVEIRLDSLQKELTTFRNESDAQFEAIRQGISDNATRFDRLEGNLSIASR